MELPSVNKPSQRRRKRSKNGNRLARSLVHIDRETKVQLAAMSQASGLPSIQLLNLAVSLLSKAAANRSEQLADELEARGE